MLSLHNLGTIRASAGAYGGLAHCPQFYFWWAGVSVCLYSAVSGGAVSVWVMAATVLLIYVHNSLIQS